MPEIADQLIADWDNAWNVHDADAMALLFHEDGTFVNIVGTYQKGREEMRHSNAAIHASFYKDSALRSKVLDARELVPGVVLAHATHELEGDARAPGQTLRFVTTWVIEQRAGTWKFAAAQNTRIMPPK
jgi:uncharacterized protein (TIGR02246 family)